MHDGQELGIEERAEWLRGIKRHVTEENSIAAVKDIDRMLASRPA
jgi:hypothetical protein